MDPFHFVHASSSGPALPLLIFAIYIAISIVNSTQTKKKKQRELEERKRRAAAMAHEENGARPAHNPVQHEKPKVMDELRRELEIILTDRDVKKVPPQPEQKKEQPQKPVVAPVVFEKKPPEKPQIADLKPYYLPETYESIIADTAITDAVEFDFEEAAVAMPVGSLDEARKGIVWSEILGPPKALKE